MGKTTTAINLGTALAAIGEEVLIVDLDPQGNASTGLGIDRKNRTVSTYDLLLGEATVDEAAVPTAVPRVSVAPSTLDLLGVELEIANRPDRAFRLRHALYGKDGEDSSRSRNYTYVLVDCPPSLNLLTINALTAAHSVLVPLQCEFFALEGLSQLLKTVEQVKQNLNPELSIHGIVLTMFDSRNNLSGRWWRMYAPIWARPSMTRSSRAMCACRRRHPSASRCCSTTSRAAAARPISSWRLRSSSANGICGRRNDFRFGCETDQTFSGD